MAAVQLSHCPEGMSGADFYALAAGASGAAMRRIIETEKENCEEAQFVVRQADFELAAHQLTPSLDAPDAAHYGALKDVV